MASTRNNNTQGNYYLEQREFRQSENYTLYENSQYGAAYLTRLPGNGLNPAQIPWNKLSNNAVEIESFLLGINSTNLVKPEPPLIAQLNHLDSANIFIKDPVLLPEPLVVLKSQRPFPAP